MRGCSWRGMYCIFVLCMSVNPSLIAGQTQPPLVDPAGEGSMIRDLMNQFQQKKAVNGDGGFGPVPRSQAALCNICTQPLYRHSDPNWEGCVPLDPETGLPKKMQRIISVQAMDPVSGIAFTAALPGNQNARNGLDRDNCWHSAGKTAVHSNVWISPDSGYAAWIPVDKQGGSFQLGLDGKPVPPEILSFVREKLTPVMEKRMKRLLGLYEDKPVPDNLKPVSQMVLQTQIPDWIKYDHAAQIYEKQKPPHAFMARLYHEGAMACRREISSEVSASALDPILQESLSLSIRRVNYYMLGETMNIRRERGAPLVDPRKPETDPEVVSLAARRILDAGKRLGISPRQQEQIQNPQQRQNYFTSSDMFLCNIILAGAQNRMGNAAAAEKALSDALLFMPEQLPHQLEDVNQEKWVRAQLKVLRQIVTERQECLKKEQEWLFKSAQRSMLAAKTGEIKFSDYRNGFKLKEANRSWDPALFAYLTGELLRRSGETSGAAAWFNAAEKFIERSLANIDAAEKAVPPPPMNADGSQPENPYEQIRSNALTLKMWNRENQNNIKKADAPDPFVVETIQKVVEASGLTPAEMSAARPVQETVPIANVGSQNQAAIGREKPENAPTKPDVSPVNTAAQVSGGGERPKTREAMYAMYFKAISAYRKDKNENPAFLKDLVAGGYIASQASCLDEKGQLICPEKNETLFYRRRWEPGDSTYPVISKPGQLSLFADGAVKVLK